MHENIVVCVREFSSVCVREKVGESIVTCSAYIILFYLDIEPQDPPPELP